jgi:hypothetical protein
LDGEFDSPPSPPEKFKGAGIKASTFLFDKAKIRLTFQSAFRYKEVEITQEGEFLFMKKLIVGLLLAVLVLVPMGCTVTTEVYFPTQKSDGLEQMTALLEGNLELGDDGWLRAESNNSSHVLIWPYGFTVRGEGKEIQVLDGDGQVVAIVGKAIKVGGGETTEEIAEMYTGKGIPDDLAGPFWLVAEVIND